MRLGWDYREGRRPGGIDSSSGSCTSVFITRLFCPRKTLSWLKTDSCPMLFQGTLSRPDSLQDLHSPRSHSSQLTSPRSLPDLNLHYRLPPIATSQPTASPPRPADRNATHGLFPRNGRGNRAATSQSAASSPGPIDWSLTHALSPQKDKSGQVITSRSAASSPGLVDWSLLTEFPPRNGMAAQDRSATSSPGLIDWSSSPPHERQFNPLPFPVSPSPIHTGRV